METHGNDRRRQEWRSLCQPAFAVLDRDKDGGLNREELSVLVGFNTGCDPGIVTDAQLAQTLVDAARALRKHGGGNAEAKTGDAVAAVAQDEGQAGAAVAAGGVLLTRESFVRLLVDGKMADFSDEDFEDAIDDLRVFTLAHWKTVALPPAKKRGPLLMTRRPLSPDSVGSPPAKPPAPEAGSQRERPPLLDTGGKEQEPRNTHAGARADDDDGDDGPPPLEPVRTSTSAARGTPRAGRRAGTTPSPAHGPTRNVPQSPITMARGSPESAQGDGTVVTAGRRAGSPSPRSVPRRPRGAVTPSPIRRAAAEAPSHSRRKSAAAGPQRGARSTTGGKSRLRTTGSPQGAWKGRGARPVPKSQPGVPRPEQGHQGKSAGGDKLASGAGEARVIRAGRRAGQVTRRASEDGEADIAAAGGSRRASGDAGESKAAGGRSPGKEEEEQGTGVGGVEEGKGSAGPPALDRKGALLDATWKAFDVDGDGVLNFDELRPLVAYNFGRDVPDVLDSDIRDLLKDLADFTDFPRLYTLSEDLFKNVVVGGNLALTGDEHYTSTLAAMGQFAKEYWKQGVTRPPTWKDPDVVDRGGMTDDLFVLLDADEDGVLSVDELRPFVAWNSDRVVSEVADEDVLELIANVTGDPTDFVLGPDDFFVLVLGGPLAEVSDQDFRDTFALLVQFLAATPAARAEARSKRTGGGSTQGAAEAEQGDSNGAAPATRGDADVDGAAA